ncbi:UDP-galactopyranose mutase [Chloroflexota bacterium]
MKKALIIGGGIAGCAATHQLMLMGGWDVLMVEANAYLGAGVRTFFHGRHPYTFGPRHFLTQNEKVYNYLNELVPLRSCADHEFRTYVEGDDAFYNYPIHWDDIEKMPDSDLIKGQIKEAKGAENAGNIEEFWVGSVGQRLYEKIIEKYNKKMWLVDDNRKIDTFKWSPKGAVIKEGPRAAWDIAISAYPYAEDGYNAYFHIATEGATVLLNTTIEKYDIPNKTVVIRGEKKSFDIIISTISPDILFEQCYGELTFLGRDLHKIVFPAEYVFPEHVYFLYYANDEEFLRLVEYKKFTHHKSPNSLVGMEIPSMNGKHYPLPFKSEIQKAARYHKEMPEGVFSMGRAGSYRYMVDIDDGIEQAMDIARQLKEGSWEHPVPLARAREFEL